MPRSDSLNLLCGAGKFDKIWSVRRQHELQYTEWRMNKWFYNYRFVCSVWGAQRERGNLHFYALGSLTVWENCIFMYSMDVSSRLSIFISFYCCRLTGQTNLQNFGIGTLCISVISTYSSIKMDYRGENVYLRNAKIVHQSPLNNSWPVYVHTLKKTTIIIIIIIIIIIQLFIIYEAQQP